MGRRPPKGEPLVVNLPRCGQAAHQFHGDRHFATATDKLAGTEAVYRYVLLVDDQPIQPNIPAVEIAAAAQTAYRSATTAMPLLPRGRIGSR